MTTYPNFWPRFVARAEKKEAANSKRRLPIRADTLHRLVRRFESPLNLALKKLIKSNNTAHFKEQEMGFKFETVDSLRIAFRFACVNVSAKGQIQCNSIEINAWRIVRSVLDGFLKQWPVLPTEKRTMKAN